MAFIRWNETTQIWEKAVNPDVNPQTWNHLPVQNPTQALDLVNKQYVDGLVGGGPFVPYNGATANVNLAPYNLFAGRVGIGGNDLGYPFQISSPGQTGSLLVNAFGNTIHNYAISFASSAVATGHYWYTRSGTASDNLRFLVSDYYVRAASDLYVDGGVYERGFPNRMGDWTTWACQWKSYNSADGVLGSGAIIARYSRVGKTIFFTLRFGAGSTTVFPASYWMFTLPFPIASIDITGSATLRNAGGALLMGAVVPGSFHFGVPQTIAVIAGNLSTVQQALVHSTWPWTWADNFGMWINGFYETT